MQSTNVQRSRRFRDHRSYACPKCGYGLVESRQTVDLLCPECGLTLPRWSCPPAWSIEIGPTLRLSAAVRTLLLSLVPGAIVDSVLRPRTMSRPWRTILIPAVSLLALHGLIVLTSAPASARAWWPYTGTLDGDYTATGCPGDALFLLILGAALFLNFWLSIMFSRVFSSGRRTVTAFRLFCYSIPWAAFIAGAWIGQRSFVLYTRSWFVRRSPMSDMLPDLLIPLGTHGALAIFLMLWAAIWWGGMAAAIGARPLD